MELQFTRIENLKVYVAEAMVNANFNIHFERAASGGVKIFQKTTGEMEDMDERTASERGFDDVYIPGIIDFNSGKVVDCDFDASVYPKVIRIESCLEVINATITESSNEA